MELAFLGHSHSSEKSLVMTSADDDCEDPRLSTFRDAVFATRCYGGFKIKLVVEDQFLLIEWASHQQKQRGTVPTEAETIEWRRATRATLKTWAPCKLRPISLDGFVTRDALCL